MSDLAMKLAEAKKAGKLKRVMASLMRPSLLVRSFAPCLMITFTGIMKNESKCPWEGGALLSTAGVLV